jgi:YbbR domain-containing protein
VIWSFFKKNLAWKIFSLLLALMLWYIIVRDPDLATSVTVPVLFKGMPHELEISSDLPDRVQLEVRGPSTQLAPRSLATAAVVLDLGSVHDPGERTYTITAENVSLPSGVQLTRAIPSQVRLNFEHRLERDVPVQVRIAKGPPAGYHVVRQEVIPDKLRIVGPETNVGQVKFVETDAIDLSLVVAAAEFRVNAFVGDPWVRFESSPVVQVKVYVEKAG